MFERQIRLSRYDADKLLAATTPAGSRMSSQHRDVSSPARSRSMSPNDMALRQRRANISGPSVPLISTALSLPVPTSYPDLVISHTPPTDPSKVVNEPAALINSHADHLPSSHQGGLKEKKLFAPVRNIIPHEQHVPLTVIVDDSSYSPTHHQKPNLLLPSAPSATVDNQPLDFKSRLALFNRTNTQVSNESVVTTTTPTTTTPATKKPIAPTNAPLPNYLSKPSVHHSTRPPTEEKKDIQPENIPNSPLPVSMSRSVVNTAKAVTFFGGSKLNSNTKSSLPNSIPAPPVPSLTNGKTESSSMDVFRAPDIIGGNVKLTKSSMFSGARKVDYHRFLDLISHLSLVSRAVAFNSLTMSIHSNIPRSKWPWLNMVVPVQTMNGITWTMTMTSHPAVVVIAAAISMIMFNWRIWSTRNYPTWPTSTKMWTTTNSNGWPVSMPNSTAVISRINHWNQKVRQFDVEADFLSTRRWPTGMANPARVWWYELPSHQNDRLIRRAWSFACIWLTRSILFDMMLKETMLRLEEYSSRNERAEQRDDLFLVCVQSRLDCLSFSGTLHTFRPTHLDQYELGTQHGSLFTSKPSDNSSPTNSYSILARQKLLASSDTSLKNFTHHSSLKQQQQQQATGPSKSNFDLANNIQWSSMSTTTDLLFWVLIVVFSFLFSLWIARKECLNIEFFFFISIVVLFIVFEFSLLSFQQIPSPSKESQLCTRCFLSPFVFVFFLIWSKRVSTVRWIWEFPLSFPSFCYLFSSDLLLWLSVDRSMLWMRQNKTNRSKNT